MNKRTKILLAIAVVLLILTIFVNYRFNKKEKTIITPTKIEKQEKPLEPVEDKEEIGFFSITTKPKDGSYIEKQQDITVVFTSAVDPDDAMFALSIVPSADYEYSWFNENTLNLHLYNLEADTDYTISFDSSLKAKDGSVLNGKTDFIFHTVSDRITFSGVIYPGIIKQNCMQCHIKGGPAERILFETYEDCMRYVVPGHSDQSRFYTALLENKDMDDDLFSKRELKLIREWIDRFNAEY